MSPTLGLGHSRSGTTFQLDAFDSQLGRVIFFRKHSLPVMLTLYKTGAASTSDLIRRLRGHPASVIATLRELEASGVIHRERDPNGRHAMQSRLTVRGLQLVETPMYHWKRLLQKWDWV